MLNVLHGFLERLRVYFDEAEARMDQMVVSESDDQAQFMKVRHPRHVSTNAYDSR